MERSHSGQFSPAAKLDRILKEVIQWVRQRPEILAVALVGSWARGTARVDSDIYFMFLTQNPATFRIDETWMGEIDWQVERCRLWSGTIAPYLSGRWHGNRIQLRLAILGINRANRFRNP